MDAHGQLMKHFHNKEVVAAIEASRTEDEKRDNPLCPGVTAGRQFYVTIRARGYHNSENEHTQGISFAGELTKGEENKEQVEQAFGAIQGHHDADMAITKDNSREKEERRTKAEAKAEEKRASLETDMDARLMLWLKGLTRDLSKLADAQASVLKATDKTVKTTWKAKFDKWESEASACRKDFEKAHKHNKKLEKSAVVSAEKIIQRIRVDVKAWNKIKDLYLPADPK